MSSHDPACYCHGTITGYTRHQCRCEKCRTAMASFQRERRARLAQGPVPEDAHGKSSTYINYRCRCEACKAACAEQQRAYRARKRAGAS